MLLIVMDLPGLCRLGDPVWWCQPADDRGARVKLRWAPETHFPTCLIG